MISVSKGLERFAYENRPASVSISQADATKVLGDKTLFGKVYVTYNDWDTRKRGVTYRPSLRYAVRKGEYKISSTAAHQLGYGAIEVPWPEDVVELPIPPWVDTMADYMLAEEYGIEDLDPPTKLCRRREVAALTEPFIRYLKILQKAK